MRYAILLAALLIQEKPAPTEAEKAYRALETKLAGAEKIDVKYKLTCKTTCMFRGHGWVTLEAGNPKWVLKCEHTTGSASKLCTCQGGIGTHGNHGGVGGSTGIQDKNGKELFTWYAKSLLAGGDFSIWMLPRQAEDRKLPTIEAYDFKQGSGEKDAWAFEFKLRRTTASLTQTGRVRLWLDAGTGWPSKRTFEQDGEDVDAVVTETYEKFVVKKAPVETPSK